jgi:hypothetical protein
MTKVNSYDDVKTIQDLMDTPCTACSEHNLDWNLCPNCKWALECNDCCGCAELEDGEDEDE